MDESMNNSSMPSKPMHVGGKCNCGHHKVVPIAIIAIGLTFLLATWDVLNMQVAANIWPILLIVIGFTKLFGHKCKCC